MNPQHMSWETEKKKILQLNTIVNSSEAILSNLLWFGHCMGLIAMAVHTQWVHGWNWGLFLGDYHVSLFVKNCCTSFLFFFSKNNFQTFPIPFSPKISFLPLFPMNTCQYFLAPENVCIFPGLPKNLFRRPPTI